MKIFNRLKAAAFVVAAIGLTSFSFSDVLADTTSDYKNPDLHYSLRLPYGWVVIPKMAIDEVQKRIAEKTGSPIQVFEAGFQRQADQYFTYPYLLIQHRMVDHLSVDELGAQSQHVSLKNADQAFKNAGLLNNLTVGETTVDHDHNALVSKIRMEVPKAGEIDGWIAILPGRDGVVQLNFYAPAGQNQELFQELLDSFKFEPEYGYSPRSGQSSSNSRLTWIAGSVLGLALAAWLLSRKKNPDDDDSPVQLPS